MSQSTPSRDRSGIWSYVPFGSSPRRRSVGSGLPYRATNTNTNAGWDPFEKSDRQPGKSQQSILESLQHAWMTQSRQARWLKAGGVMTIIVMLYWFLTSSGVPGAGGGNVYTSETSPTTKCSQPHDLSKPLIQYAIMIDAGSTGSRIHIYKFNNCGPTPELEGEEFKMNPGGTGLSSFKKDAQGAAHSLDNLLDVAMKTIPDNYKSCSPIAVKATAGLRLLGPELSNNILEAVRKHLEDDYPFPVISREKEGVVIMPGEQEGVFAWITTNYLLGKIGGPDKTPTAAVFDLGGGSTQIVFQPTYQDTPGGVPERMAEGDHKYSLKFGGREFELYQHSHLGYGLMSAREALHRSVLEHMHHSSPSDQSWLSKPISNPCIAPGMTRRVNVTFPTDHPLGPQQSVVMSGPVDSLPAQCRALAEGILYKEKSCAISPCSFNGVHQPSLSKTFSNEDIYIFSYFYDRTHDLGMPESFTLRELQDLTARVCGGESSWGAFSSVEGALADLKDRPEWCLDLNFMSALLHTGYEMPIEREVKIAKKIKGNEVGWCLGASLPLLEKESGWECKVSQIA